MTRWDDIWSRREKEYTNHNRRLSKEPSAKFYIGVFGFTSGFLVGMVYTLLLIGGS